MIAIARIAVEYWLFNRIRQVASIIYASNRLHSWGSKNLLVGKSWYLDLCC